ncbi:MAG: hypothetical protein IJ123_10385 [Blautia sp.]|nr:hypothetical protein [Blautia sp.]
MLDFCPAIYYPEITYLGHLFAISSIVFPYAHFTRQRGSPDANALHHFGRISPQVPEKLHELLIYLANTNRENACNPELAALQSCIDDIKTDSGIKAAYMDLAEYIEFECNEATEEIRAERDDAIAERDDAIAKLDAALCQINEMKAEIKILQEKLLSLKM